MLTSAWGKKESLQNLVGDLCEVLFPSWVVREAEPHFLPVFAKNTRPDLSQQTWKGSMGERSQGRRWQKREIE